MTDKSSMEPNPRPDTSEVDKQSQQPRSSSPARRDPSKSAETIYKGKR